jgi:23S rRNA pseudouridine1911/1915/1917 synthase
LKAQFAGRRVSKSYLALVEGSPCDDGFAIDYPLKGGGGRVKVKVNVDDAHGAASVTSCEVLERYQDPAGRPLSLLRCVPLTGRQHQIRAHLRAAGYPLVGDKLYGPSEDIFLRLAESGGSPAPDGQFDGLITQEERAALRLPRQALHAATLSFAHPQTKQPLHFESPLPADIAALIAALRTMR